MVIVLKGVDKYMRNTLFVTMILCVTLILSPLCGGVLQAQASADDIVHLRVLNGNYDDGDSPTGSGNGMFEIVSDPGGDTTRGKVGSIDGHVEISYSISNNNKIYVSYDFRTTSSGDRLRLGLRNSSASVKYIFDLGADKFGGVSIKHNEWYTAHCVIDYSAGKQSLSIVDSAGNVLLDPTESTLSFSGSPTHIRFRSENDTEKMYIDNIVVEEDIIVSKLDKVTGSDGEANPLYTNNVLKIEMTGNMGDVTENHISLVRDIDGSAVPISSVAVSGNVLTLTLGKALQSASAYTLSVLSTAPMKYKSTPVGVDMSAQFVTSSREIDITDVAFTSDGTGITCVATLENATASDASVVIMISAFDTNGRVTGINYTTVNVNAIDSAASSPLQIPVSSGGYVKVIGISNFNTLAPLNNNIYTYRLK